MTTPGPQAFTSPPDALVEARRVLMLGQTTAMVAHDLNNLLGKIIGLAEIAADGMSDRPEACAELETLIAVAEEGAGLVARLGAYDGLESVLPQRFDLASLASLACEAAARRSPGIQVAFESVPGPCWIVADAATVRVALDALLDNAAQAGASSIRASCRTQANGVEVVVQDNGIGLAPEVLARAFEPFFTTAVGAGRGLGLTLAGAAMTQCDGRIELQALAERGAIARLTFPPADAIL